MQQQLVVVVEWNGVELRVVEARSCGLSGTHRTRGEEQNIGEGEL